MNTIWINSALRMNANLKIVRIPGTFMATVSWPHEKEPITVKDESIENLIEKLDNKLQEDAADEMIKNGDV